MLENTTLSKFMRILYVIDSLSVGGAERMISNWIIFSKEHPVGIYVLKKNETQFQRIVEKADNVNVYNHNILYSPLHIIQIAKCARKYDIVHVNLFPALYWAALARVLVGRKCKFVYTEHSTYNKRRRYRIIRPLERWIYHRYDGCVAITEKVKESLNKWLGGKVHIVTINNGIDVKMFSDARPLRRQDLGVENDSVIILMTASFTPSKDQKTLVKAYSLIEPLLRKKVYLFFAGEGPLKKEVEKLVEELGLSDYVIFLGIREDIPALIKTSDICVLSSVWEGFGLAALEYMAAKKPIIASNVDGLSSVVKGAGLLFQQGDEYDLSNKITSLIKDLELRSKIAEKCYCRSTQYDVKNMLDSYMSFYKSL